MKFTIDSSSQKLVLEQNGEVGEFDLFGREAYDLVAHLWLKLSWNQKYSYTFTWLGRPVIQHPEDMIRLQEVIYTVKPDVIIETGVAHGGSLIYSASLLKAMGRNGKVVGVDIEIRPHNRAAIEAHDLSPMIALVEGNSVADEIVAKAASYVKPGDTVLVILDSNHSREHVAAELKAYASLVTVGSYLVATDGVMKFVHDTPLGKPEWIEDNPANAAEEFVVEHPEFVIEEPKWLFNESALDSNLTCWPSAWLKRI